MSSPKLNHLYVVSVQLLASRTTAVAMSNPSVGSPTSLPGSLPSTAAALPDVPPPAFPTPIQMARAAAEARSRLPPAGPPVSSSTDAHRSGSVEEFNPSVADKLPFHRLLDSEVSSRLSRSCCLACCARMSCCNEVMDCQIANKR